MNIVVYKDCHTYRDFIAEVIVFTNKNNGENIRTISINYTYPKDRLSVKNSNCKLVSFKYVKKYCLFIESYPLISKWGQLVEIET